MCTGDLAASAVDEVMGMSFGLVLVQDITSAWKLSISQLILCVAGGLAAVSFGHLASSGLEKLVPVLWGSQGCKALVQCGGCIQEKKKKKVLIKRIEEPGSVLRRMQNKPGPPQGKLHSWCLLNPCPVIVGVEREGLGQ